MGKKEKEIRDKRCVVIFLFLIFKNIDRLITTSLAH